MINIYKYLFLFLSLVGCSTNPKIIKDSRVYMTKAAEWKANIFQKDSGSGIIFKFTRDKNVIGKTKNIDMFLWAYPLDTIAVIKKIDNVQLPWPVNFADVTYIDYKIENDTIKISSKIDSTDQIIQEIPPNRYLLFINSHDFSPKYLKDIRVIRGYWSIIPITMYESEMKILQ